MTAGDPRDDQLVLSIDLGTGGPKVGFVSVTGRVVWQGLFPVQTRWLGDGGAVQDAGEWWSLITNAARSKIADGTVDPRQVVAVGITGQWASTVPVDAEGVPVGDCIMWQDHRGIALVRKIVGGPVAGYNPRMLMAWVRKTAGIPSGNDPVGHMLNLAKNYPEVARVARWYLEPVDYLAMRFTGVAAGSHASMTAAWLTDNRDLSKLSYDDDLVRRAGIDRSKLPPLVPTASVVGEVSAVVASELGLQPGVKVVAGVPDLHAATIGAGALDEFQAHMALSTTSWIGMPVPVKKTDVVHGMASVPGLDQSSYVLANNHDTSGLCLQWLRDNILDPGDALFASHDKSFDDLTALAAGSPPGANSVVFTPWLKGERTPVSDSYARGGLHNLSLSTTRADIVRSVMEGVAYNNRWLFHCVEKYAKRRIDNIRFVGGGAVSAVWCQIHADVFDRSIEQVHEPLHAQLRGVALLAGVALGLVRKDEVGALVGVDTTFAPNPANRKVYDDLYAEFPKLYKAQKGMFTRLNR